MIDFTNCEIDRLRTYGGANGGKICIFYNSERYMLKFPPVAKKNNEMSYSNGCISEHLASSIYRTLGIPTQETFLGTYKTGNSKEKIVVACKDFCIDGKELASFAQIKNTCVDSEHNGFGVELELVLDAIESQKLLEPTIVKERFWEMFAADALLGNFDRHNGNWGFLIDKNLGSVELSPVFDNGSCLYPQLTEEQMKTVLADRAEIEKRIYVFPTSALKINDKKINYFDFLTHTDNAECISAFEKVYENIDFSKILPIINELPVGDIAKEFYHTMIHERKNLIMDRAWEHMKAHIMMYQNSDVRISRKPSVLEKLENLKIVAADAEKNMKSEPVKNNADITK